MQLQARNWGKMSMWLRKQVEKFTSTRIDGANVLVVDDRY